MALAGMIRAVVMVAAMATVAKVVTVARVVTGSGLRNAVKSATGSMMVVAVGDGAAGVPWSLFPIGPTAPFKSRVAPRHVRGIKARSIDASGCSLSVAPSNCTLSRPPAVRVPGALFPLQQPKRRKLWGPRPFFLRRSRTWLLRRQAPLVPLRQPKRRRLWGP